MQLIHYINFNIKESNSASQEFKYKFQFEPFFKENQSSKNYIYK